MTYEQYDEVRKLLTQQKETNERLCVKYVNKDDIKEAKHWASVAEKYGSQISAMQTEMLKQTL